MKHLSQRLLCCVRKGMTYQCCTYCGSHQHTVANCPKTWGGSVRRHTLHMATVVRRGIHPTPAHIIPAAPTAAS